MHSPKLVFILQMVPLMLMLTWAAIEDARTRRIRNWLTFSMIVTGLAQSFIGPGGVTPVEALLGLLAGLALTIGLFILGAIGAGDVKLMAGIGAWVGAAAVLKIFCVEAAVGMVIVLLQAWQSGRLALLLRNSATLAVNIIHVRELGLAHTTATGQSSRSIDRPLPYAVPVLIAVILLILI